MFQSDIHRELFRGPSEPSQAGQLSVRHVRDTCAGWRVSDGKTQSETMDTIIHRYCRLRKSETPVRRAEKIRYYQRFRVVVCRFQDKGQRFVSSRTKDRDLSVPGQKDRDLSVPGQKDGDLRADLKKSVSTSDGDS